MQSITANSVTEGDGQELVYTIMLDRLSSAEASFAFSVAGDAIGGTEDIPNEADYLNAKNIRLSNEVVNNGDGSITIPAGLQTFSASVPVIDDTLIENTETAILTIGSHSGIGQIFDNDPLPNPPETIPDNTKKPTHQATPAILNIDANAVREGDGNNLLFKVRLNQAATKELSFAFNVSGDAIGGDVRANNKSNQNTATKSKSEGQDYVVQKNHHYHTKLMLFQMIRPNRSTISMLDNVILTKEYATTVMAAFTIPLGSILHRSVPVIDDTLIENTETAILSIGSHSGIGQIFDNDSLRTTGLRPSLLSSMRIP